MAIVVVPDSTTTAQDIVDCTSQDIRSILATSGADSDILLDYINRVQMQLLRQSRWEWLLSDVQRFMTEDGQVDYWLGATGSQPYGQVDTGLNLTDLDRVKEDSVYDRSQGRNLLRVRELPSGRSLTNPDMTATETLPRVWRQDVNTLNTLTLWPAFNNSESYTPSPNTPQVVATAGGALAARTYFIKITFVDTAGGESQASGASRLFIPASSLARVKSPRLPITTLPTGVQYTGYHVYAGTTENSETKQTATSIAFGTDWTEPVGGLIAGAAFPTTSTLEPLRGHLIEFRYYKDRPVVDDLGDTLVVPDVYKDIVCAGVNALAFRYLKSPAEARGWFSLYRDGMREIVRDINLPPRGGDFIRGDSASIAQRTTGSLFDSLQSWY